MSPGASSSASTPSSRRDAAGKAGNAHLQTLEVGDPLDRLAEPAGHLHAGIAGEERHQIELVVDLAPQLQAAAVIDPAVEADEIHAEGHGGEVLRGEDLAGPEIGIGVVHLDRAGRARIEAGIGRDQLAGAVELNLDAAARHFVDALAQVLGAARAGRIEIGVGPVEAGHPPIEGGLRLDHGRGRNRAGGAGQGQFGEIATSHGSLPCCVGQFARRGEQATCHALGVLAYWWILRIIVPAAKGAAMRLCGSCLESSQWSVTARASARRRQFRIRRRQHAEDVERHRDQHVVAEDADQLDHRRVAEKRRARACRCGR